MMERIRLVAGVVLREGNAFLLVQEKLPPAIGQWNLPAGKVEDGMTVEQTAVKEAKEETGFDVKIRRKIGVYPGGGVIRHAFEAEIVGGKLLYPKDEILDAGWFSIEQIEEMKPILRGDWVWTAIQSALRGSKDH